MNVAEWRSQPYVSDAMPIVIGGCGRSGTTLLRVMLDSHPNICCGPESELFLVGVGGGLPPDELAWRFDLPRERIGELQQQCFSLAEFIERFFAEYAGAMGKRRWAEKTPKNVVVLDYIFAHFSKARFVHVIRDGRDVACSLRTHPRHQLVNGQLVKCHTCHPIGKCIERWVNDVRAGLAYRGDPRYCEVRYEDLVLDTEQTLQRLLTFLGEPWDKRIMAFHTVQSASRDVRKFPQNPEATKPLSPSSIGQWRSGLTRTEAALFKALAGTLLCQLGYAADDRWEPDGTCPLSPPVSSASQLPGWPEGRIVTDGLNFNPNAKLSGNRKKLEKKESPE